MNVLRRALALALFLLVLPGLTLAEPIHEPPSAETLVEGHAVFTTIDAYQALGPMGARSRDAADEPTRAQPVGARISRDAGVLWFNDQYLTPPAVESVESLGSLVTMETRFAASVAALVRADDGTGIREPCGGAVLAVNAGDPDPRGFAMVAVDADRPDVRSDGVVTGTSSALIGDPGILPVDYWESYRIVDPNDRVWVIDKYLAVARISLMDGATVPYEYPVWVVNLFGGEAFVPDTDEIGVGPGDDCSGHVETADGLLADELRMCGVEMASILTPSLVDDPCMESLEPSRNAHCYSGPLAEDRNGDGFLSAADCETGARRRYHAMLYFRWEDLRVPAAPMDHSGPVWDTATNGCESGTEWPCPGEAPWEPWGWNDDAEGNSHSFHPAVPPHWESEPCPVPAPNPTNHGGSTWGANGVCDYLHATARVDVYYTGTARPPAPAVRAYTIDDLEGSAAPFHDFHAAYPGFS